MPVVLYAEQSGLGDGDPVLALPGTGTSVPRGIEAVFQYNGLTMNDTHLVDKYRITQIDGLDDPDVRDSREDNVGTHGETAYDAFYGGRTMAITGKIESWTVNKLRDMQQAIRMAFADLTEKPFFFLTGNPNTDHFINVRKFSKLQWSEEQKDDLFFRDFLITVRASNPRFFSTNVNLYTIAHGLGVREKNVINAGNFEAQPTITITGPITAPAIYNIATDQLVKFKATTQLVDDTQFRRITFDNGKVTIVDQNGANAFSDLAYVSDHMTIKPGEINALSTDPDNTGIGTNTDIGFATKFTIQFRNSWI